MPVLETGYVKIDGLAKLQGKLSQAEYQAPMKDAMTGAAAIIHQAVATYPPETAANKSPGIDGYRWYERGFGTRTRTGKAYQTSQTLGRSWTIRTVTWFEAIIGTKATYARPVQDRKQQAEFHKARGWVTVQTACENNTKKVTKFVTDCVNRILAQ